MTCGMCVVAIVLSFYAYPSSVVIFIGAWYDDVDDVLAEHFDALGHDLSFRSWE